MKNVNRRLLAGLLVIGVAALISSCVFQHPIKYGYLNEQGVIVIKPQFDMADCFSEGLAAVKVGSKWGFIDKTGKMLIAPQFVATRRFYEGLCAVLYSPSDSNLGSISTAGGNWGYIDTTGKMVIPPNYCIAERFASGLAWVRSYSQSRVGGAGPGKFINKKGEDAVNLPVEYANAERSGSPHFSEGLIAIAGGSNLDPAGFINKTGAWEIPAKYATARNFSNGVAAVCEKESNLWGYIDHSGKEIIKPQFKSGDDFFDGFAAVRKKMYGAVQFIDMQGKTVIEPKYKDASWPQDPEPDPPPLLRQFSRSYFSNGSAIVLAEKQDKYLFLKKDGSLLTQKQYDHARPFSTGLAAVAMGKWTSESVFMNIVTTFNGKWGYIDINGTEIIPLKFDNAGDFREGLAPVGIAP